MPARIVVEGTRLMVCSECSSLGEPYFGKARAPARPAPEPRRVKIPATGPKSQLASKELEELEVVDDYASRVRASRVKLGLSQEDLAKKVKEKLSVVQKIEAGRMAPDIRLARLLEHTLRTRLLAPRSEVPMASLPKASGAQATVGDIAKLRGKAVKNRWMGIGDEAV